ncbi:MAG: DUF5615 family PIN-like protein [Actinomycetota bacterium]|nr:DUF5615 family PIN-like protein [Actinomycetota bacterium]
MKLLADEGGEARIVERLRFEGHDVEYVAELAPGTTDDDVLDRANAGQCVLVTVDKAAMVASAVRDHGDQLFGAFTVVSHDMVRIRPPL